MSNYKKCWKEFPSWSDLNDYTFLEGATPPQYAWEQLRRLPEYRCDWHNLVKLKGSTENWVNLPQSYIYTPIKLDGEGDKQWMSRSVEFNVEPQKERFDIYLARKWGLFNIYDPNTMLAQDMRFINPRSKFPNLLLLPDDLDPYLEEHGEEGINAVGHNHALIAFDLRESLTHQLKSAHQMLTSRKKKMISLTLIKKSEGHSGKIEVWKRHLRVLDALRVTPKPTSLEIATVIGANGDKEQMRKAGDNYVEDARIWARAYQKTLLFGTR